VYDSDRRGTSGRWFIPNTCSVSEGQDVGDANVAEAVTVDRTTQLFNIYNPCGNISIRNRSVRRPKRTIIDGDNCLTQDRNTTEIPSFDM
jgi:hypothetical protein